MTEVPVLSVAIPSFNSAATLSDTLDSVLTQTWTNLQVIVVDDGSTDNTSEVLHTYQTRIDVISQPNGGLASARNAGCRAARGEFVALMDADDICEPNRFAVQLAFMQANPDVGLCSTDFIDFNDSGLLPNSGLSFYYSRVGQVAGGVSGIYPEEGTLVHDGCKFTTHKGKVYSQIAQGNFVHPPTIVFRRALLDQCGFFDESIINMCDHEWLVRFSRITTFGYIEAPLLRYRRSERQMSGSRHYVQAMLDNVSVLERICKNDPELLKKNGMELARQFSKVYLDAADALSDHACIRSLKMVGRALQHGSIDTRVLKVIIKAITPLFLIHWWRKSV